MRRPARIRWWCVALLLAGCRATQTVAPTADGAMPLLLPADWGCAFQLVERLSTTRDGSTREVTALASVTPGQVRLVAVTPVGLTLFELVQAADGGIEVSSSLPLPEDFDPVWVLRDFQQIHAPGGLLEQRLRAGWRLTERPDGRVFSVDGESVAEVRRIDEPGGGHSIHLVNLRHGYTLSARAVSTTDAACVRRYR